MNTPPRNLIEELQREACRFDFFQILYLLETYAPTTDIEGSPESQQALRKGDRNLPLQRFRCRPVAHLAFPPTEVDSLEVKNLENQKTGSSSPNNGHQLLLNLTFLGLYGPASPLPTFYTENIIAADPEKSLQREFLDVFHHRLFYLLYRVWKKYRYYLLYQKGADAFSQWMFSLIGLGEPLKELRDPQYSHIRWERLLSYVGLLSMRSRSAAILENIMGHYFFDLPVTVTQCVHRWVAIEPQQQNRLGERHCTLGQDVTVGETVSDRAGKFEVNLGPLDFDQRSPQEAGSGYATFCDFLPPGKFYHTVRELVKFFLIDQLDFDVVLILKQREMPCSPSYQGPGVEERRLYLKLAENNPCQLGWSSWLGYYDKGDGRVGFAGR